MEGLGERSAYLVEVGQAERVVLLTMAWVAVGEVRQKVVLRHGRFLASKVQAEEIKPRLVLEVLG